MKQKEIRAFMNAYGDNNARDMVQKMMIRHYADAVLEHHPDPTLLDKQIIRECTAALCGSIFHALDEIEGKPDELSGLLLRLSRGTAPRDPIWFRRFNEAYEHYRHRGKLEIKLKQLMPYLTEGDYADIGCGGGDLTAYLKQHYPGFSSCTGIDVMDWRSESVRELIRFRMFDFSRPKDPAPGAFDFATCMAVLHHVGNDDDSRIRFLQEVRKSMRPSGKLLVEEDVILPPDEIAGNEHFLRQVEKRCKKQPLFAAYLSLTREEQEHTLILIDLLANSLTVGVPSMDFPFGFETINGWIRLFGEGGWRVENVRINGFVPGTFNRSSHVVYLLGME